MIPKKTKGAKIETCEATSRNRPSLSLKLFTWGVMSHQGMLTSSSPHFTGGRVIHKYATCASDLSTQLSVGEMSLPPILPGGVTPLQLSAEMEGAM